MQLALTNRQEKATSKLYKAGGGAVWWRVGCGKTRIAYAFFAMIAKHIRHELKGGHCNFLVVCRREAFQDWVDERRKMNLLGWTSEYLEHPDQLVGIINPPKNKVWILSHGKLDRMVDELCDVASVFDGVAFDEGFLYKNAQTKHAKAANSVSQIVGRALVLSGSMMTARNLEDIYGQLYAVNRHQSIGRTLTDFRSRFMYRLTIGSHGGSSFVNRRGASKDIMARIREYRSVHFPSNNNRRIVSTVRVQPATTAQAKAFARLRSDFYIELEDSTLTLKNTPSLIIKCQQISDGWLKMGDGDITLFPSAKLTYLLYRVTELLDAGEKIVIWCAFKYTVTLVLQALQKSFPKVGIYSLIGGTKFNRTGWVTDGSICVATEASGSSVNFLKDCSYAIYYSMGFRWLDLQQSQGRTNRHDSAHGTCFYTFLQTEGSLDSHVYKIVHSSSTAEKKLIELSEVSSWLKAE